MGREPVHSPMRTTELFALAFILSVATAPTLAAPATKKLVSKPPSGESPAAGINHTVQKGETLSVIAEKYYGDGYQWIKLKEYNPWIDDEHRLPIDSVIFVPDPRYSGGGGDAGGSTLRNPGGAISLSGWAGSLSTTTVFGRSLQQVLAVCLTWFVLHFSIQGIFVWFAAHLAFVKDVSIKKALKVTLHSETLAFISMLFLGAGGLFLLYVTTTSPGNPMDGSLLTSAEEYVSTKGGLIAAGFLLVVVYAFLGIRFIPSAFGVEPVRGMAVVLLAILIPHIVGLYLVGHRMGLIE